jgi:hypothetical protein
MKKSTNPTTEPVQESEPREKPYRPPLAWEIVTGEGGLSVAIIYPLVVLFFLKMAYSSFG